MANNNLLTSFFGWIENKSQIKYYPYYLGLLLLLYSLVFVFPDFLSFNSETPSWKTVILKSNDLTNSLTHISPGSWLAKKVFRLTIPVIMKVTHLSPLAVIIFQCFTGYLLFVFCYKLTFRILSDSVSSTLLTAGVAFLYFGRAAYFDLAFTWFDAFAYFFILMALYSKNIFAIFLFSSLAAWTDERAYIALSIVFLFHQLKGKFDQTINFKNLIRLNKESTTVIVAMVLYLAVRLFLQYKFDMHTPSDGANLSVLGTTLPFMKIGIWTFLEGFWLLYLLSFLHSFRAKNYFLFICFFMPLFVFIIISGCVTDITRSGSYIVPMLFLLICYLRDFYSKVDLRLILLICFFISFLYPATIVCAAWNADNWLQDPSFIYASRHVVDFLIHNF